jgi:hypothetical protein
MDAAPVIDLFHDKHREFLNSIKMVWVGYSRRRDRLRIRFRTDEKLPRAWFGQLSIIVRHDEFLGEETLERIEWIDTEGSLVVMTCARPRKLLPDADLRDMSEEILPIGDVILFSGSGDLVHEHPLYNELSMHVMSREINDLPRTYPRGREDKIL